MTNNPNPMSTRLQTTYDGDFATSKFSRVEMESSEHYLTPFLSKTLPELGLGYTNTEDAVEENEDALDEVIQLLRASSETHSDINEPWTQLKNDIIVHRRNEYMEMRRIEKEQEILTRHSLRVESSNIDKQMDHGVSVTSSRIKEVTEMDEMKRALVEKYAYDESVLFDEQGNEMLADEEDETFISNRQIAQQQHLEKMQELRTAHGINKKDEREKTKLAKLEKNKQKEDRRIRAQKGERRA